MRIDRRATGWAGHLRAIAIAAAVMYLTSLVGPSPAGAMATAAPAELKADRIIVLKSLRRLELLRHGVVLAIYPIALGDRPVGPKRAIGDGRTPEGTYVIDGRHEHSPYHLALHISYPNAADRSRSSSAHLDPGGDIFIHGLPAQFGEYDPAKFYKDWTKGCISVGNKAIEKIWAAVADGTPIEIRP